MAQIFHPSMNSLSRVSIFGAVFIVAGAAWALDKVVRSPWVTQAQVVREQPVAFSHRHHVQGLGIDCRYCHTAVEDSPHAGIPSTKVCMSCHSMVWTESEMLAPVRESFRTDVPIAWVRVHDLPDFTYFDHSIHVRKGVACESCHGRVDEMPLMWRENTLNMDWCLSCHRDPLPYLRPREDVFTMGWEPEGSREELARRLVDEYDVRPRDTCSACHR